jgi:hypothetical protein
MNRAKPALAIAVIALLELSTAACTHSIHQLYVGTADRGLNYSRGKWVKGDTQDFVILDFAHDTSYVEKAVAELERQCPGRIAQVTTEHLTSFRFLSHYQKVVLKGWCQS